MNVLGAMRLDIPAGERHFLAFEPNCFKYLKICAAKGAIQVRRLALIEQAGLKGLRVGGACVSEKHAGFVVNDRNATARDVLDLIRLVQARVLEHSGVRLETEVRILGEE